MKEPRRSHVDLFFGRAIVFGGTGAIVYSAGIVVWQCFNWLQYAYWTPIPISYAMPAPVTKLAGFNVILNWIADCPASVGLAIAGIIAILIGMFVRDNAERHYELTVARIKDKLSRQ